MRLLRIGRVLWIILGLVLILGSGTQSSRDFALASRQRDIAAAGGFLIIAPERFHSVLGDYVRYKQRQLPTELVSLEKALASASGVDDPERLKRYLYNAWRQRKIGYVLLVGDADVLPVRYM